MKKTIKPAVMLLVIFLLSSCLKENHSIRLRNSYMEEVDNVVIGTAQLGNVPTGTASDYKPINVGNFSISGSTPSGKTLSGSGSVSGKGTHKWTATLSASGGITLAEDK